MQDSFTSATDLTRAGSRAVVIGLAAIVLILGVAAFLLFKNLPDTGTFNAQVERLFAENANLTEQAELRLLEILAQSGTTFTEVLVSYRAVIFVLMVFASALLITSLVLVLALIALNRKLALVQKAGIQVSSLVISRAERKVYLNDLEFNLTEAAGATRIKRLRDSLGNQIVSELMVRNIARQGYTLDIDKDVIRMI